MKPFTLSQIRGVIAALITPFDQNESLDLSRTKKLVDFLMERKINGLYLTGSTGEGFLMTSNERKQLTETVVERVNGRLPVIVHVGDIGTKKSIDLALHAYTCGADAISSVPPFYWKFSQDDIYQYYKDLSQATPLPMVIYNVPMAGLMGTDLLLKLSQLPNVKGLKFTGKDHDQMTYLKAHLPDDFMIYSGCDEMALSGLCSGANGLIGSFYNIMPELFLQLYEVFQNSSLKEAIRLQTIATEIILESIQYDYLSLLHTILHWQGIDAGFSRRPFHNYTEQELTDFKIKMKFLRDKYHILPSEVTFLSLL